MTRWWAVVFGAAVVGCGPAPAAQTANVHVEGDPPSPSATADAKGAEDDPTGAEDGDGPQGSEDTTQTAEATRKERNARTKAVYKRGIAAQEAGRFKEALELYYEANRVVPGAMPKLKIAQCLEALGRNDEAIRYYEIFISEAPNRSNYPEKVEEARRRVDALRSAATTKPAAPKP
ncbi:MAG: tetratricopeptide repeat protein [Polyangiaceae bacterium]